MAEVRDLQKLALVLKICIINGVKLKSTWVCYALMLAVFHEEGYRYRKTNLGGIIEAEFDQISEVLIV